MASNYVLVRLTRPQADAALEALCFRTAGEINAALGSKWDQIDDIIHLKG